MTKNDKYIDGLSPRKKPAMRRTVGIDGITIPVKHSKKKSKSTQAPALADEITEAAQPRRRNIPTTQDISETEIAEDFIKPVESFDLNMDLDSDELLHKKKKADTDQRNNPKKPKKKWSKKRKIITGILIFLALLAGIFYIWGDWIISKLTGGNSNLFDAFMTMVSDDTVPLKKDANGRTNILAIGTSGYEMDGSGHDGAQLTDSIMVISLDQETKDVAMFSLPRDLKVGYTCTATGKINEVYWCANQEGNDENAGTEAISKEVSEITGLDIQYWVHVDWGALVNIVDTIGGITVTLDEDIADPMTETYIKAGVPTTLNGPEALGLARARHGTANGDFTRGASQQKILVAIKDKIVQKGLSITDTIGLVAGLGDNLRSSFSTNEVKTLAKMLQDYPLENMRTIDFVGEGETNYFTTANIGGISYVIPTAGVGNYSDLQAYLKSILSSDPVVREGATITVLNGSGVSGVAGTERDKLKESNLTVSYIDDAPYGDYPAKYYIYDLTSTKPETKKWLENHYGVTTSTLDSAPAGINYYNTDFVIIVGAAPAE